MSSTANFFLSMKLTTDFKGKILGCFSLLTAFSYTISADAGYPAGYYDSLEGKCGYDLMMAVKAKVRNHSVINYGDDTWYAFLDTDVRMVNGRECWWDMYSNNNVTVASGHPGMNIEHSVANSWWGGTKNDAYKDIVHLNPSNADANSRKSNYPLGEIGSGTWDNGVTFIGKPKSGSGGGSTYVYEPCDDYKGDFARVFMYMFTVYNDMSWRTSNGYGYMYDTTLKTMFKTWAADMLMRWHRKDPVSDKELNRNDGIYKHQKNRNPFIDLPELAEHIWGSKSNVPFSLNGSTPPVDPDDPGNGDDPENPSGEKALYEWLGENDTTPGDWTVEDVVLPASGSKNPYVWEWSSNNGKYYYKSSAFISNVNYASKSFIWSPVTDLSNVEKATLSFDHAAKYQDNIDLCKLAVRDAASNAVTEYALPNKPQNGTWNFTNSGDIDLTSYAGKKIQVGFKYESKTNQGCPTWEVRNVKLSLTRATTDVTETFGYDDDDSFLVEVWGNNILVPEGARIFDINGREVAGENMAPGIYIVTKPTFNKSIKVLIK